MIVQVYLGPAEPIGFAAMDDDDDDDHGTDLRRPKPKRRDRRGR